MTDIYEYVFWGYISDMRVDRVITLHEECLAALQEDAGDVHTVGRREAYRACAWPLCPEKLDHMKKQAERLIEGLEG